MNFFPIGVTYINTEKETIDALLVIRQMQKFGHGVQYSETSLNRKFLRGMVLHYKTCKACFDIEQEKKYGKEKDIQSSAVPRTPGMARGDQRSEESDGGIRNSGDRTNFHLTKKREEEVRGGDKVNQHRDGGLLPVVGGTSSESRSTEVNIEHRGDSISSIRPVPVSEGQRTTEIMGGNRKDGGNTVSTLPDAGRLSEKPVKRRSGTTARGGSFSTNSRALPRKLKRRKKNDKR